MSTFKKCKVVMLPTKEKAEGYIVLNDVRKLFNYKPEAYFTDVYLRVMGYSKQHLYILSNDKIKEGDWKYFSYSDDNGKIHFTIGKHNKNSICTSDDKKIIATTDKSLLINIGKDAHYEYNLPQLSEGFIQKYIERYNAGNPIKDVMVEYEEHCCGNISDNDNCCKDEGCEILKLKINPKDNTITIKAVKDSWNRDEVEKLLYTLSTRIMSEKIEVEDIPKWIEENL